ncbi:MAG: hypothetical protein LUH15_20845 [Tannerellaceae bacterium]|nr:hypothetical protein [Tannerellaceae bacterium]
MTLKRKLKTYLSTEGKKKIICTYDKIPYLLQFINPKAYRLLIDEYHSFIKAYSYRDKAINGILENYSKFKSFCFLSATGIPADFKPDVLFGVTEYITLWKEKEKITVLPFKTNKPYMIAAQIIKAYQDKGFIEVDEIKSYEAYFFVNSVTEIADILKQTQLTDDECRIICADNIQNKRKLAGFTISSSTDKPKKFNFITSKSFEGVDYHSETGMCFVVSNVHNKHTLISVDMDIPQIAGRIRTKTNPHRNKIIHIFNTKANELFKSYEEMKEDIREEMKNAQERVNTLNALSIGARKQQREELIKTKGSYIKYDKETETFIVDDMRGKLQLYSFKLNNQIYTSGNSLRQEYQNAEILTTNVHWEIAPDAYVKNIIAKPTFRDCLKRYIDIKENNPLQFGEAQLLEERYPILSRGYHKLGLKELKRHRSIKSIEVAIESLQDT